MYSVFFLLTLFQSLQYQIQLLQFADFPNVLTDKTTGEYKLGHHISSDGFYKGRKVIADKPKKVEPQEEIKA